MVEVGGKKYDGWMTFTAKHRSEKAPVTNGGTLRAENFWVADGKDIVKEELRLTVLRAQENSREMEVELTWEAVGAPVTLRGSAEAGKSYGGLSARFAAREGTTLRADGEVLTKDEDLTPRKWAELEGSYGGKRAALRITPDAKNLGAPHQWCLRAYGFVGASFPGRTATVDGYTLEAGKPLTLKFRVSVRGNRGQTGLAANFRQKAPEIRCQSGQSPGRGRRPVLRPVGQFLLFDFGLVEFDSVAGARGKGEMGLGGDRRGLLEVVVGSHLEDEVLGQRTDRGRLTGDEVQGCMEAVSVRNHGDIEE